MSADVVNFLGDSDLSVSRRRIADFLKRAPEDVAATRALASLLEHEDAHAALVDLTRMLAHEQRERIAAAERVIEVESAVAEIDRGLVEVRGELTRLDLVLARGDYAGARALLSDVRTRLDRDTASDDPRLPTKGAADVAGVSPRTIRRWVSAGRLKPYGKRGHWRFRRCDVLAAVHDDTDAPLTGAEIEDAAARIVQKARK